MSILVRNTIKFEAFDFKNYYLDVFKMIQKDVFLEAYNTAKDAYKVKDYKTAIVNFKDCVDKHFYKLKKTEANELVNEIKDSYYHVSYIVAGHIKLYDHRPPFNEEESYSMHRAVSYLQEAVDLDPFNTDYKELYRVLLMYLAKFETNNKKSLQYLQKITGVYPESSILQYNIGHKYQTLNEYSHAIVHYKLCLALVENEPDEEYTLQLKIKCLNGLGAIFFNAQRRHLAKMYFEMAYELDPEDPDVNNQLGVIYTDLRLSRQAIDHYTKCIENAEKSHLSPDVSTLRASTYMNMGLMYTYTGQVEKGIECYNTSLKYKPGFSLAFQNKLLDINYLADKIDPMYISKLHRGINKCYPRVNTHSVGYVPKGETEKLRIGFLSGDFICHPVSYFTCGIFEQLDTTKFEMYCYSTKVIKSDDRFPRCTWRVVRNMSCDELVGIIKSDKIDILIDLSGNTGDNRMDVLAEKPAPVIINAIGYPNTSGLESVDYKFTDKHSDSYESEKYYSEKLLYFENSFLCYTPHMIRDTTLSIEKQKEFLPKLDIKPEVFTFGCFNRYNKYSDSVVKMWCDILSKLDNCKLVLKTKEFSSPDILDHFWGRVPEELYNKIEILPYKDTYEEHLLDYNKIHLALDTIPYSGTTTTCEALIMGVPVLVLRDDTTHLHIQNIGSSIMYNSDLSEFVSHTREEFIATAVSCPRWDNEMVRDKFMNGYVYNKKEYIRNLEQILESLRPN